MLLTSQPESVHAVLEPEVAEQAVQLEVTPAAALTEQTQHNVNRDVLLLHHRRRPCDPGWPARRRHHALHNQLLAVRPFHEHSTHDMMQMIRDVNRETRAERRQSKDMS